jgi:ElaB/YqjD/DUF883 family membrane-anchored ribosome-binding protein
MASATRRSVAIQFSMNSSTSPEQPNVPDPAAPTGENAPLSDAAQKVADAARQTAQRVQESVGEFSESAKARSAEFVENRKAQINRDPATAVLQALLIGFAIGLLVRFLERSKPARASKRIDVEHKPTLEEARFHIGSIFLPFVWPFYQGARRQYQQASEKVQDAVEKVKETDLRKVGRKSAKKVEQWVDEEVTPTVECGWKKLRKLWS